ncbi:DUF922 domain-containing protein [Spirosoma areae]
MILPRWLKSKFILLLLPTAFSPLLSQVQPEYTSKIIANGKLKWEDFSGPVDPTSTYAATTHYQIVYTYKVISIRGSEVSLNLQVSTRLRGNSWVKPTQRSDELLAHEQGHFDIARIHALKFKKAILSTVLLKDTYREKINLVFQLHLTNAKLMGLQYDEETNHSLNKSEQKKWSQKLNDLLLEL